MAEKLLAFTDENTILITTRFIDLWQRTASGVQSTHHYDMEFIVKKNITVNQFLDAIEFGLEHKIQRILDTNAINKDAILVEDELFRDSRFEINIKFSETTANDEKSDLREMDSEGEEASPEPENADKALDELKVFRSCQKLFSICRQSYQNDNYCQEKRLYPTGTFHTKQQLKELPRILVSFLNHESEVIMEGLSDSLQLLLARTVHGDKTLEELGFVSSTVIIFSPNDEAGQQSEYLFDKEIIRDGYKESIPLYNISNRPQYHLNDEPIKIIPPTDPPRKDRNGLIKCLLQPILMVVVLVGIRKFMGSNSGSPMLYAAMGILSIIMALFNFVDQSRNFKMSKKEWKKQYQDYIRSLLKEIEEKQECDKVQLKALYPATFAKNADRDDMEDCLARRIQGIHPDIFSRGQDHPDFLTVRIGLSTVGSILTPSVFPVEGEKKEYVFTDVKYKNISTDLQTPFEIVMPEENKKGANDYLLDLPANIARKYAYLDNAPVLLNLKKCETLGVVFPKKRSFYPFLDNLIMNLCYYHSPDDLQIVLFCNSTPDEDDMNYIWNQGKIRDYWTYEQTVIEKYKHLPHFRELLGNLSAFAFNQKDANLIYNRLLEILTDRKQASERTHFPQILLIFQEEYEFKRHPISEFLPESDRKEDQKGRGISFVFCKRFEEELPKYCGQVLKVEDTMNADNDENKEVTGWYLFPHNQKVSRSKSNEFPSPSDKRLYRLTPDDFHPSINNRDRINEREMIYSSFKVLSALYYYRIAQGHGVPESVELFDILGNPHVQTVEELSQAVDQYICQHWGLSDNNGEVSVIKHDVTKSLDVPVGVKAENDIVNLDLHEKADGPHMLVAGTTGSGKTETILTFLIGLCAKYSPEQVNLLLMDMKGAGFVKRIGDLPHVVGKVTDVDGDETGTGMLYMLKRFLNSMSAEVKRRKLLLSKMGVDSLDGYIAAYEDKEEHIRKLKLDPNKESDRKRIAEIRDELPRLAHLFLVVDEFTELMRFTSNNDNVDFRAEITSLARVGRSLGFHIILISQNIENAITPDIRVNSKARLCLRVASREASKEMIGTELAGSPLMPGNGRAYLLVGTGSRFEYFQSGYSGASIIRNQELPYSMTFASMSGRFESFFSTVEKLEEERKKAKASKKSESTEEELSEVVVATKETLEKVQGGGLELSASRLTQLELVVKEICSCYENAGMEHPRVLFQQPLPSNCCYDYDWTNNTGKYVELKPKTTETKKKRGLV